MRRLGQTLFYFVILVISSCGREQTETNFPLIFDIKHYCELTEQRVSRIARDIELEGGKSRDVAGFKKLDSCLNLRKKLFEINDDNVIIKQTSITEYKNYLTHLSELDNGNKDLQTLYNESALAIIPAKINLEYISDLARFEHVIIENYLPEISPVYCGFGNRVFSMQETKPFTKDETLEVLLISDFSTSRVRNYGLIFSIDSILIDNKKFNVVERLKTIDRICHLILRTRQKGQYRIYGHTELDIDSIELDLAFSKYPFNVGLVIE